MKLKNRLKNSIALTYLLAKHTIDADLYFQIGKRFKERRLLVQQVCKKYRNELRTQPCEIKNAGLNFKYVNDSDLIYCAIEKTGSTLWKRIMHVIGGWGNSTNPTSIKAEDAQNPSGGYKTLNYSNIKEIRDIFKDSKSLMFVRDPYTKLFSAWLDKFYSPNLHYWTTMGPQIVKSERESKERKHSIDCAPDVSFSEFISYILKQLESMSCIDGHFAPNYKHCLQCELPVHFIGKYETLKEDIFYMLNAFNLSDKVTFNDFNKDAVDDAVTGSSEWVFSQKDKLFECDIPFHCALFKVWNLFQSRGILSKKSTFPYKSIVEVQNITKNEFMDAVKRGIRQSEGLDNRHNRFEALQQAYQQVPFQIKAKLLQVFKIDFLMFGYNKIPSFFDSMTAVPFKYFKQCTK